MSSYLDIKAYNNVTIPFTLTFLLEYNFIDLFQSQS